MGVPTACPLAAPPLPLLPPVGLTDMGWGLVGGGCGNPKSKSPDSHSALQSSHQHFGNTSGTIAAHGYRRQG